ncbi:MAG: transglycosylase domain-containing protein [Filifactoraceae bacterium]
MNTDNNRSQDTVVISKETLTEDTKNNKNSRCLSHILKLSRPVILTVLAAIFLLIISAFILTPKITPEDLSSRIKESSLILDANGQIIDKLQGNEFRTIVPMEQISPWLQQAVVAIEDERFYRHKGIDIRRIAGAIVHDLKTKSLAQGASTINMQLAKNLYTSTDKSFVRKFKDMIIAIKIDSALSKEEVLHAYLSTVPLSRGCLGVEAASIAFFDKHASALDLAESAILAGVTKYPSKFTPYITEDIAPDDNLNAIQIAYIPTSKDTKAPDENDQQIYSELYRLGIIDVYKYDQLKSGSLYVKKALLNPAAKERQEVVLSQMLKNGMIDNQTYEAVKAQPVIIKLGQTNDTNLSSYFADALKVQVQQKLEESGYTHEEAYDLMINGGLRIHSTIDSNIQKIVEREVENPRNYHHSFIDENGIIQPQSAFVIIDQKTGFIKAMTGGRGIGGNKVFNRALNPRQPGSSIKPLAVYMPALEKGYTAASTVKDGKRPDPYQRGKYWPKNSTGYKGISTMSPMIWNSSNVAAVEFLNAIGIDYSIESLKKQGITTLVTHNENPTVNDENLALGLGGMTRGVTPLEITSGFATIANNGTKMTPYYFSKIEDRNGKVILTAPNSGEQIFSPENSSVMVNMLEKVVTRGTGRTTRISNMPVAGKTGTTSDEKDIWFVGFTPYYTAGVWVGNDKPSHLYDYARMSNTIWRKIMADVHKDLEYKEFNRPDNVRAITICQISGDFPRSGCPRITDYFANGTEPVKRCRSHSGNNALGSSNIFYNQDENSDNNKKDSTDEQKLKTEINDLFGNVTTSTSN